MELNAFIRNIAYYNYDNFRLIQMTNATYVEKCSNIYSIFLSNKIIKFHDNVEWNKQKK